MHCALVANCKARWSIERTKMKKVGYNIRKLRTNQQKIILPMTISFKVLNRSQRGFNIRQIFVFRMGPSIRAERLKLNNVLTIEKTEKIKLLKSIRKFF